MSALADALPRLAAALADAADANGWDQPPALVRITAWTDDEGFDLGVRPLDGSTSVVDALCGFMAPADWLALGVVTEGNARHLDGSDRRRVRCVHLVERDGASASIVHLQGDEAIAPDDKPAGRIDDAVRRALGLSTDPPERSTIELWAIVWLDRLRSLDITEALAWDDLVEQHPALAVVPDDLPHDDPLASVAAENLIRLGEILAEVHDWPRLRASCAAGEWPVDDLPPEVASWLDDGAFSRWVLGTFPPLGPLTDTVCSGLAPELCQRIRKTLRSWGLDPSAGPGKVGP